MFHIVSSHQILLYYYPHFIPTLYTLRLCRHLPVFRSFHNRIYIEWCLLPLLPLSLLHPLRPRPSPCVLRFIHHFISGFAFLCRRPVTRTPRSSTRTFRFLASYSLSYFIASCLISSFAEIDLSADGILHPFMTSRTPKHTFTASPCSYRRKG